ncbi:MAG: hypothetical protein HUU41_04005 [Bryobacteraceae bacterium]|nr:hypothetical protein [Bryobacterales bacterium]MEB2361815.1 hypothetical protein [Bryobacterales bacterium]NUN00254.1 hypothetical protein [Bryobacteraceae bacterium]
METVQLAITDVPYANALREILVRNGAFEVLCVDRPDSVLGGVLVLDADHLDLLPAPLANPERVVLIARNDPTLLTRAWEAGVNSVVFEKDPLNTVVLAIMSARLRLPRSERLTGGGLEMLKDSEIEEKQTGDSPPGKGNL